MHFKALRPLPRPTKPPSLPFCCHPHRYPLPLSSPLLDATKASRLFQNKGKSVVLFQEEGFNPHLFIDSYFR